MEEFGFLSDNCVPKQAVSHERQNPFNALRMKDAGHQELEWNLSQLCYFAQDEANYWV